FFPVRCETICVHSDTPNAIEIARAVRTAIAPWH
ncbi:lactam utilization protein LamB, partial [Mesorhizobium sp. M7A.F.Ca.US.001.01.1.1]